MSELLSSAAGAGARRGQGPGVRGRALGLRVSARPAEESTAKGNWRHSEHSALCDKLRDIELLYVINQILFMTRYLDNVIDRMDGITKSTSTL